MKDTFRLIWFQHFHKAAGTTIVQLARNNGEKFWEYHRNGNPVDEEGFTLPLWEYSPEQMREFVDQCESQGVTFVATEFGCPNFASLHKDQRVISITMLRDPLRRIISNYEYDLSLSAVPFIPLSKYIKINHMPHCHPNYYVQMLSMHSGCVATPEHKLEISITNLQAIDHCLILDNLNVIPTLAQKLGWSYQELRANSGGSVAGRLYTALRMRSFARLQRLIWLEFIYARRDFANGTAEFLARSNLDQELIRRVKAW